MPDLAVGTEVHYVQRPTGRRIYNGVIAGAPKLTRDQPEDEPYEIYPVQPSGWNATTWWCTEVIAEGHVELDYWPGNGVAFNPKEVL